jgi:TonB family protein
VFKLLQGRALAFAKAGSQIAYLPSMACLWPGANTTSIKAVMVAVSLASLGGVLAWCSVSSTSRVVPPRPTLPQLERSLRRAPVHISEFPPLSEPLALPKCGNVRPPEALLTPDPLPQAQADDLDVRVSFIVGSDGHVHSAFILDSGGPEEDQTILRVVRSWRYRPALCNGVPTDSEARVRFSLR